MQFWGLKDQKMQPKVVILWTYGVEMMLAEVDDELN